MEKPVQAGIRIGMLLKQIVPGGHWKLGYNHGGFAWVPALKDFKQVPTFIQIQLHQAKIVNYQQIESYQLSQRISVSVKRFGPVQIVNQLTRTNVFNGFELAQCTDAEGAGLTVSLRRQKLTI